jgi:hypothetical protein
VEFNAGIVKCDKSLVWRIEGGKPLGKLKCSWKANIKISVKGTARVDVCIGLKWLGIGSVCGLF